ncbi:hypothetical protein E3U55_16850 [Filobacillus milosensis]|uniref:Uncharacterized protein n=1 Tax=Filobacillus milosensis TaxID=94137 RepID=A0A4Y8ID03_9BACI|nr:hypothetical protein E3U55_16850 [Filobacillus milosensis]
MVTFLVITSVWSIEFYQNSSIEKVINNQNQEAIKILEKIESHNGVFVIYDTGKYIEGRVLKKGLLGWKITNSHSPIINGLNFKNSEAMRIDYIGIMSFDNGGYYFGYVNPKEIDRVKFQYENFNVSYNIQSYYWYLPMLPNQDSGSFKAEQFSVILKNGKEVFYPFEELQ